MGGAAAPTELAHLPLGVIKVNGRQPRRRFDADGLAGLAESVRAQGVVQPINEELRGRGGNRGH